MMWSGLLIYWANDIYPFFFPSWFYQTLNIPHRLSEGMALHFTLGWFFILNGLIYVTWYLLTRHWRRTRVMYNFMQRSAYVVVIFMAAAEVLTGFSIYKPVQLSSLLNLFGGYETARWLHFYLMMALAAFIGVHVIQVIRAGWNNFRAMVAGFEVGDE
jgi:thiosulfate reductase cytochrome b subunit